MAIVDRTDQKVCILLENDEDVWFWERRFNVFDFLELFPMTAVTPSVPEGAPPPRAETQLTVTTDAGFSFSTDIIRGGFYWRNQSRGTRKWMADRGISAGDTIVIERTGDNTYSLRKHTQEDRS